MLKKFYFVLFLSALPVLSLAQSISIKTVPVATGDQFLLFPSRNSSMSGASIALDDPLLDPFINPAKGTFVEGMKFLTSPVYYGISFDRSSAKASGTTLPLGLVMNNGNFFGGILWARQELTSERGPELVRPFDIARPQGAIATPEEVSSPNNNYTFVMGGLKLPDTDISIGASVFWADLNAIEGVQHLYASSSDIRQSGYLAEYRVGLTAPIGTDKIAELIVLRHQSKMIHDVTYIDGLIQRLERNADETEGWAIRAGYREEIGNNWTLGLRAAGNWKWHPKIPNYALMNIPRDPGNSSAYNLGIGFAKRAEKGIFVVEYIYEPIWSNTWADAAEPTSTRSGGTIQPGWKTVNNDFRFWNSIYRLGFHRGEGFGGFDLGLQIHTINYLLNQEDYVRELKRSQEESWTELTFTGGIILDFTGFDVRYGINLVTGAGRPGVESGFTITSGARDAALETANFIIAPSGKLTLDEAWVLTHQVSLVVEIN